MNLYKDLLNPSHRLNAPEDFADRVMDRIHQQGVSPETPFSVGKRILGMAAMVIVFISLGILIGSNSKVGCLLNNEKATINEFKKIHHLHPVNRDAVFLFQ